jgi:hypothetical protein
MRRRNGGPSGGDAGHCMHVGASASTNGVTRLLNTCAQAGIPMAPRVEGWGVTRSRAASCMAVIVQQEARSSHVFPSVPPLAQQEWKGAEAQ